MRPTSSPPHLVLTTSPLLLKPPAPLPSALGRHAGLGSDTRDLGALVRGEMGPLVVLLRRGRQAGTSEKGSGDDEVDEAAHRWSPAKRLVPGPGSRERPRTRRTADLAVAHTDHA